ncbi:uncharacterized protein HMPREF1541_06939 [Cyphellophora europaea CBS 101466]|uniref:Major facilitator superfamily (MFS) profile domain-containing protein n=1 Tax=Cyphellophora europaea (strain CBS 101466) TaxID=1220924 RepID=W2RR31_CYPE1|nr:uncharacterized protein HMPREF1541_06939 [Cyphellophora europaea CBS 101466]ETN38897.1 hypothetical protein HMPREF1541_06939 [Cyphellophora europaea CBS 101466]
MPGSKSTGTDARDYQHVAEQESPLLSDSDDDTLQGTDVYAKAEASQHARPVRPTLGLDPTPSTILPRRHSFIDEEEQPHPEVPGLTPKPKDAPVTWTSLPQKTQLAVLTLARLSEPLSERSLSAYMFYQLRWFSPDASEATIASQGGILTAAFAAAQFLTAVWWGRAADSPWIGRKPVLLVGLFGTFLASVGIGFSTSFGFALFCRIMAGFLNGNIGVMRTMISEIIKEKKYQSRAFLLLPMCFNVGVIIGPILGGFLADPVQSFPSTFGPGSSLGGKDGVSWMKSYPYALPNLVSGIFIFCSALGVIFFLEETHEALRHKPDWGRKTAKFIARHVFRSRTEDGDYRYAPLHGHSTSETLDLEDHPTPSTTSHPVTPAAPPTPPRVTPLRSIFTRNVTLTLLSHHLLALHVSTFNALIFLLLPTPRSHNTTAHLPFLFTGGLGLTTEQVGVATAIIGAIGLPLQILLYPSLNTRLGTLRAYRLFLPFSVAAYILLPFCVLLPATPSWLVWPALTAVFALQVLSRTFALPSTVILVNNSAPGPRALGTIHGFAQSVSSGARTAGPVLGGWALGWGLRGNCVGGVWWGMAGVAGVNWALLWWIWEGDGSGGRAV